MPWVSTGGYRGYQRPANAIVGTSYTGEWEDSPVRKRDIEPELREVAKHLRAAGFPVRRRVTRSANVFMVKVWLTVPKDKVPGATTEVKAAFNIDRDFQHLHW